MNESFASCRCVFAAAGTMKIYPRLADQRMMKDENDSEHVIICCAPISITANNSCDITFAKNGNYDKCFLTRGRHQIALIRPTSVNMCAYVSKRKEK